MLTLSSKVKSIPFQLQNSEDGTTEGFELQEMKAADRDAYLDSLSTRVRVGPDGKPQGVNKFEGMQADLVCRCAVRLKDKQKVSKEVVQAWPSSTVASLFEEAQKLNRLNATGTEIVAAAKNA